MPLALRHKLTINNAVSLITDAEGEGLYMTCKGVHEFFQHREMRLACTQPSGTSMPLTFLPSPGFELQNQMQTL